MYGFNAGVDVAILFLFWRSSSASEAMLEERPGNGFEPALAVRGRMMPAARALIPVTQLCDALTAFLAGMDAAGVRNPDENRTAAVFCFGYMALRLTCRRFAGQVSHREFPVASLFTAVTYNFETDGRERFQAKGVHGASRKIDNPLQQRGVAISDPDDDASPVFLIANDYAGAGRQGLVSRRHVRMIVNCSVYLLFRQIC
jgi:hypothetical protein